jgi:transposase-like protein
MGQTMQMTTKQFDRLFPNEEACDRYLIARRWPKGPRCPRCGSERVYPLQTMEFKWECPDCREGGAYRFSHLVGTIFENTKIDLLDWFKVINLMLTSKKGVSARQIHRYMGFGSYKTAWYMCHRIRAALTDKEFRKLMGIVEVDETYIGGKNKNRHWDKKQPGTLGDKSIVIGAVSRKGNVVARVIENTDTRTLDGFVRQAVSEKFSLIATAEHSGYRNLKDTFEHGVVQHSSGRYVDGVVQTQTIDGFWSLLKRGIMGSFHKVSRKYLPLYVAEFEFRYNNRDNAMIFETAIAGC